ncbi:MAG: Uma2 family endonuclease [Scytonematopsis contorta HA4267-MV1]|jgi:Uma2 family endonuclease|nr:Uma2 family endonuclease [Scytonematopsis contorta HA4267-MV1]
MTQALPKLVTFEEFISWLPNDGKRYELHKGVIIEMPPPSGDHEDIAGFLARKIGTEFDRLNLPYNIPKTAFVKTPKAESAYSPDVLVINRANLTNEPLWKKESTVTRPESVPLVIEVVSTNWRDDYYKKFADYEEMGIPEFWIVDYKALGGRNFIGNPKQPTIFVCELIDGEYKMTAFTGNDLIISPTFPQLNLTAQQIFDAAN